MPPNYPLSYSPISLLSAVFVHLLLTDRWPVCRVTDEAVSGEDRVEVLWVVVAVSLREDAVSRVRGEADAAGRWVAEGAAA